MHLVSIQPVAGQECTYFFNTRDDAQRQFDLAKFAEEYTIADDYGHSGFYRKSDVVQVRYTDFAADLMTPQVIETFKQSVLKTMERELDKLHGMQ